MIAFVAAALLLMGDVVEVGAHRTPGKPMQFFEPNRPAEEIVAKKEGQKILLAVRVNVPREGVTRFTEETAELTAPEWASLVEIVAKEKLLEWKPEPKDGAVFDWGSAGIRVRSEKENAPTWASPLKNEAGPSALSKRLAALARDKIKGLKLFYLSP